MANELFDPTHRYQAPANANLTYRGGPLMSKTKVVGVFFNELDGSPYALTSEMEAFLQWFVTSSVIGELAEYDSVVPGDVEEVGSFVGGFALSLGGSTPPPPPPPTDCNSLLQEFLQCVGYSKPASSKSIVQRLKDAANKHKKHSAPASASMVLDDAKIQQMLVAAFSNAGFPQPDDNTLYCLFFPTGVQITAQGSASCTDFCGYHDNFSSASGQGVRYAVLPYPDCQGCLGGMAAVDSLTSVTTHEIAEAVTDPVPGSGWYDDANGEIGDICAWQTKVVAGNTVQLLWSDKNNACI